MKISRRLLCGMLVLASGLVLGPYAEAKEREHFSRGLGGVITLGVRDTPIAEVFEMLSRKEQVNILIGPGVEGRVSVNLYDVDLDMAIRSIADAAGFVAERRESAYVVIKRDAAGKDFAHANTVIRSFRIDHSDPKAVADIVEKHLSRYGEINVLESRRFIIVEDLPDFVDRIERLLVTIDRAPRQILIEAKILEITLDANETFGIDWTVAFSADDGEARIGVKDLALATAPGLFFDLMTSDIELAISALADRGRVRALATPTLRALENQPAEVVIGDRLGFRVTTTINQVTTESIEFLESGVILQFTASVNRDGKIVLKIHPEVSTGTIADGLPAQTTTEVTTTLVTESGERVFIGGLMRDTTSISRVGVPFLMDIPVLGYLFRRSENLNLSTETIVILTATLIGGEESEHAMQKIGMTEQAERKLEAQRERLERNFDPVDSLDWLDSAEAATRPASPAADSPTETGRSGGGRSRD